ncbi:hypothetical protein [Microbacterium phyllosphaerae]|uniref:hypothetical protein n=1 Tax=Microbacterium phyllosphaerae TaxID=124798 RepID=UPI003D651EDB
MHLRRPFRIGAALCVGSLLLTGLMAAGSAASAEESAGEPDFGPNVHIIEPTDDPAQTQSLFESLFGDLETAEFTDQRAAVLFKPGEYSVDAQLGYYTSVAGLGLLPDDVSIDGQIRVEGRVWDQTQPWVDDALTNFWRSLENVSITPSGGAARWAVSQAAPMRRVHIQGDLQLYPQYWGFSSGGFLADSVIDGEAGSGPQQQWYTRNSEVGSWAGSVWNQAFTGVEGAPATSFPSPAYTTVDTTTVSREKPFLYVDDAGDWQVFAPALAHESRGASWTDGTPDGESLPIGDFFIAQPDDSIAAINAALSAGRDLILTPGIYEYSSPIEVTHPDTIVLGMGYATVVPTAGNAAVEVADVDGVRLAGFTVEAGEPQSDVLIRVGGPGASEDHAANPTSIQDVYVRIGGARAGSAVTSLEVNSDDVIIDHIWMWRADHGAGAEWDTNRGDHGLVVNGDDVSAWGLFVEHYQKNQVVWNGNGGSTFFYQSELPYDPPTQADWMDGSRNGYASYRVADTVTTHTATALGVYSFFNSGAPIDVESAIQVPLRNGVQLRNMVSVFLAGNGSISHVVNDQGAALVGGFGTSTVMEYPGKIPVPSDVTPPTVTVKSGAQFTVERGSVYNKVSVKLHDAGKIDRVSINGVVKDLVNDAWSDVNGIRPGVFGAVRGVNTLVAYDVAGNAKTFTFDLR